MTRASYLDESSEEACPVPSNAKKQKTEQHRYQQPQQQPQQPQPSWIMSSSESDSDSEEPENSVTPAPPLTDDDRASVSPVPTLTVNETAQEQQQQQQQQDPKKNAFTTLKCGSLSAYKRDRKISEGGYGVVSKARHTATGRVVALKQIKFGDGQGRSSEGMHISGLREITTLQSINHANIIKVHETVFGATSSDIYLVMEYVEHDVRKLITPKSHNGKGYSFSIPQVKCLVKQLLSAVGHLHDLWILHRDLKTNNMLYGSNGVLKLCDFGMARLGGDPLRTYTPLQFVLTLGFRPPEGLLGAKYYTEAVDIWGVGCAFAEILTCKPLFEPTSKANFEVNVLNQIFSLLGTPTPQQYPDLKTLLGGEDPFVTRQGADRFNLNTDNYQPPTANKSKLGEKFTMLTPLGLDLLGKLLAVNPEKRINATDAFQHGYFEEEPLPCDPMEMPKF